jgi:hypothetical protein
MPAALKAMASAGKGQGETRCRVTETILVQYVGFQVKDMVREYTFAVRDAATEPLQYTLTIENEAFVSRRARYQDAPEICSLRLHRELDSHSNHPPTTHFSVTDAELASYQDARKPKPVRSFQPRREE